MNIGPASLRTVAGVAVLVLLAWWWLAGQTQDAAPVPSDPAPEAAAAPKERAEGPAVKGAAPRLQGPARAADAAEVKEEDEEPVLVRGHVHREGTRDPVPGLAVRIVLLTGYKFGFGLSGKDGAFEIRGPNHLSPGARLVVMDEAWIDTETATGRVVGSDHRWTLRVGEGPLPIVADVEVVPAARLLGVVRLPDGRPAVGASVRPALARSWDGPGFSGPWRLVDARLADPDGTFRFDALPEGEEGRFRADMGGYPTAFSEPVTLKRGEVQRVEITFHAPRYVEVEVVRQADGEPVPNARVVMQGGPVAVSDSTDTLGHVRLGPLGAYPARMRVEAPGYLDWRSRGQDAWGTEIVSAGGSDYQARIRLVATATIVGRVVLPKGVSPPEEWSVDVLGSGEPPWQSWSEVQADGSFRAEVPVGRRYVIVLDMDSYQGKTIYGSVDADAGAEDVVLVGELKWDRYHVPEGTPFCELRILGPNGDPVRAEVEIRAERDAVFEDIYDERIHTTDEGGRVRIPVDPRSRPIWVYVSDFEGWKGARPGAVLVGPLRGKGGSKTVRLPEARRIEGRVLQADGRPAQGIPLWVKVPPPASLPEDDYPWWVSHSRVDTDGEGRFVATDLGETHYLLEVDENAVGAPPDALLVASGSRDVEIRLLPSEPVELRVVDDDGVPVGGARVEIGRRFVDTDLSGRARIGGLASDGLYDVEVDPPRKREREYVKTRLRKWRPRDQTICLPKARDLVGVVVDSAGRAVPRARVQAWSLTGDELGWYATTDDAGSFRCACVPPGTVRVAVLPPGTSVPDDPPASSLTVETGTGERIRLLLPSRRDLRVRLTDPAGRSTRIDQVVLTRIDGKGRVDRFRVDLRAGGAWFFCLDPLATYRVWGIEDFGEWYVLGEAGPGVTKLELTPRKGGEIRGRILLPRAFVHAWIDVSDRGVEIMSAVQGDGTFVIRGVPPGRWRIRAERSVRGVHLVAETTGAVGETVELDLRGE